MARHLKMSLCIRIVQVAEGTSVGTSSRRLRMPTFFVFRTYDSVEFKVGPFLNVIIGPNGTGKSTIVCAICLGLGGKTGLLGRAQHAVDFIKYDCQKARIELELKNTKGENKIIVREIHKNSTNHWWVNGRQATLKSVEELVASLNIQVGNLCQFLPQEKVADFAKMTQEELLENTEKAIGKNEMYENHQRLKESRNEARGLEQALPEYEMKRREYEASKKDRDQKAEELKRARIQYNPLQKKLDSMKQKRDTLDGEMKAKTGKLKEYANKAHSNSKEIEAAADKLEEIKDELKLKKDQEQGRKKKIQDLRRQLEALQNDYQKIEDNVDVQPQLDSVGSQMSEIHRRMTGIQQEGEIIKREVNNDRRIIQGKQQEIKEIQNIETRRLEHLRSKHRDTYNAVMWCKENMDKFQGAVHLPLMLSMSPKDPSLAKFIEMNISSNDMKAFVFENSNDYRLFMNEICDKQKLRVNAVKVPQTPLSAFKARHPISHYSEHGFHSYLKEFINCADGVMRYLCAQYNLHNIPVGNRRTKERVEIIKEKCPELSRFYTDEYQYSCKRSRHDGSFSSRSTKIRDPTWLTASVDTAREQSLTQELRVLQDGLQQKERKYGELQRKSQELETKMNQLREEKKRLTAQKDQKKRLQSQIEAKHQRIGKEEKDALNIEEEEGKATKKMQEINIRKCQCLSKMRSNTKECVKLSREKIILSLRHANIVREHENLVAELRDQSQILERIEREFERAKSHVMETKDCAKKLLDAAKKKTNTPQNSELSPELKQAFEDHPQTTLEEIDSAIHEQRARADSLFQTDERVIHEYHERKKEIHKLESDIIEKKKRLDSHKDEIEEVKRIWIEPLTDMVEKINENFGHFFSCMNCAGEVDLNVPSNPEDYEKYGIKIKVKFRDSEILRELTAQHQSGGERSVSTVLYMMALQEMTKCPFRCVDEINQGMDPINERKVFELVVNTVCKRSCSQYFLLTPKLLPDLEYANNMTVLCVCNGPLMLNHTEWNIQKFVRRRRRLQEDD
ncbi:hypothetical protein FSP39_000824 [Pinctada imbricata]|uniref:Structural maintenance of chromosomes protein 5 n=1 Tax=Pinctada imbricata TaxID=66713 RepID=A0AA89BZK5_PINIB|nr:hypothetical protein FSP39_000824 [Pinctada imbricata]